MHATLSCRQLAAAAGVLLTTAPYNQALSAGARVRLSLPALGFIVTLERATRESAGEDEALWRSGVFDAEVYPDLPPARTVAGLVGRYLGRVKEAALFARHRGGGGGGEKGERGTTATTTTLAEWNGMAGGSPALGRSGGRYVVRTVPVQTSRKEVLRQRLAAAAGVDSEGAVLAGAGAGDGTGRPADALLLLSGGHPVRRLPFAGRFLPDVYDELRLATSMRSSGHLPKELAFWAVANPLTEADEAGIDRIRRKVDLGAEVILTQPPLAWKPFERWLQGVTSSGALEGTTSIARDGSEDGGGDTGTPSSRSWISTRSGRSGNRPAGGATLLVGMPVITSRRGLQFWLDLCGVNNRGLREEALNDFEDPVTTAATAVPVPAKGRDRTNANASSLGLRKIATEGATKDGGDGAKSGRTWQQGGDLRSRNGGDNNIDADRSLNSGGGGEPSFLLDQNEYVPFGQAWFETTMSRLKDLGGDGSRVAGVHVMAPGSGPRERARALASTGVFGERRE